jgi:hypothetical protein
MKNAFAKPSVLKIAASAAISIIAVVGFSGYLDTSAKVAASASGPSPSHTNAPNEDNCTACHVDFPVNSGGGEFKVAGLPNNYLPNQQIPMTVTLNDDAVKYGFQITAIDSHGERIGTYTLPKTDPLQVQLIAGIVGSNVRHYVEHTSDGTLPVLFGTKSWSFTFNTPDRRRGKIRFYAAGNAADSDNSPSGDHIYTTSASMLSGSAIASFDGDSRSDLSVFRPSNSTWYTASISTGLYDEVPFGQPGDVIVPGDYDGDGKADRAVWRPSNATWYFLNGNGGFSVLPFGEVGDIPTAADYDGDLKTDVSVWRPSTGTWFYIRSSNSAFYVISFGVNGDKPVPADYDGDAKADIALFRPSNSTWYVAKSTDSQFYVLPFGEGGDEPVQSDYDGDGRADLAVFRPSNNTWYFLTADFVFYAVPFGQNGDRPAPADYDGDGATDIAVYRNGSWFILSSETSAFYTFNFGVSGDIPIARGYIPTQP